MADTLTESFCERCGTRYEFEAPTRLNPLRKTRGFIGGLRNYLTSQDALSDAMGDAMRSEEDGLATAQLDAFHESFNFCIDCRQYTCINCWNDDAGRCRSCAPIAGTDDLVERLAASAVATPDVSGGGALLNGGHVHRGADQWPSSDLETEAAASATTESELAPPDVEPTWAALEPEPEPERMAAEVAPEPEQEPMVAEPEPEPEPVAAMVELEPEPVVAEPEPEPVAAEVEPEPEVPEPEPEPVAAEVEPEPEIRAPLHVVAWDEDAEEHFYAPSSSATAPEAADIEPQQEPVAATAEPGADEAGETEPIAAEADVAAAPLEADAPGALEPAASADVPRPLAPISQTILRFHDPPAPVADPSSGEDLAAQRPELAARRAQLDLLGLGDPGEGPVAVEPGAAMPYRSRGAAVSRAEMEAHAQAGGSFWEASAREVASAAGQIGVQSCGQCGLSLSANARFCRRCGTRQARSA